MNGFAFAYIRIKNKAANSTNIAAVRKNASNAMAQKNAGDASPTASVLTSVRPWWTKSPALATGKATGSIHQKWLWRRIGDTIIGNGHRGVIATLVERKTQFAILAKSKTKQACRRENALNKDWLLTATKSTPSLMTTAWSLPNTRQWRKPFLPKFILPTPILPGSEG